MPAPRPQDVLVRAARLYYLQDKSQGEVAKELGLSRSSISRILAAAREQGVVEVRIHDPSALARVPELGDALCQAFAITSAVVVPRRRGESPVDVVGQAAARLFEERVTGLSSVALSWGNTVDRFVEHVELEPISRGLVICPLVGGLPSDAGPAGNTSLEVLAGKCGAKSYRFESPAVVESRQTWAAMNHESTIVRAIERAAEVEVAFVGIGSYGVHNSRRVVQAMQLSEEEAAQLAGQAPAGDICGRYYDLQGRPVGLPTSERVIGITLDQLRGVPEVIGLAGGVEKAPGVIGALRTGALDSVVVDEDLARAVLNLAGAE
ncbi:MAG: MarR family transcriptional regulator [Actinobacteria bacterium]|uniref:sugar-binding transcriptional regulator n=1 Tax=Propionicimonas sp. T2.31MG-18 TaxID=3157620 RepID=UPI0035EC72F2|nr:MarR family transcriptional regulator [Actinomycetota bacterium]